MKHCKRLLALAVCFVLGLSSAVFASAAQPSTDIINGILAYHTAGEKTVQDWIDNDLSQTGTAEWYVMALAQYGGNDFSEYQKSLQQYLEENTVGAMTTRQKYALAMIACDGDAAYVDHTANTTIGEQGVMSWIFGLHLLNNGCRSDRYSQEEVVQMLLSLQLDDGGWAVMGSNSDVDVTAMAIQALSVHCASDEAVKKAVEQGIVLLSSRQTDSGGFAGFGTENAESIAQVLLALSCVGIDCQTDTRFVKNGNDIFDALMMYRLNDGSFSHVKEGEYSDSATAQVFCAAVAYERMRQGKIGFYLFDDETETAITTSADAAEDQRPAALGTDINMIVAVAVFAMTCVIGGAMLLSKKRNIRNVIVVIVVGVLLSVVVWNLNIQTPDDYYADTPQEDASVVGSVSVSIRCDAIDDRSASHIPDDGVVLDKTVCDIVSGDTVFDVVSKMVKIHGIQMETVSTGESVYIKGLANIYEMDFGDLSGWLYRVNGETPTVGCAQYEVVDGDEIELIYSCNMGFDL